MSVRLKFLLLAGPRIMVRWALRRRLVRYSELRREVRIGMKNMMTGRMLLPTLFS